MTFKFQIDELVLITNLDQLSNGNNSRSALLMKNGHIKAKGTQQCHDCCKCRDDDMWIWLCDTPTRVIFVCGDCRYVRRTGHAPPPVPRPKADDNAAEREYHGGYGSATLNRFAKYHVTTERGVEVLNGIIDDCSRSLD